MEERLTRLEGQLRWSQRLNLLVLAALAGTFLMGQAPAPPPPTEVITTQKLRIVDEQGRARANFFATGDDVYLLVGDATGKPRIGIKAHNQEDATLFFAGPSGEPGSTVTVNRDGWLVKKNF